MASINLPLSQSLVKLAQSNSEELAKELKQYLENNNKLSKFEVREVYPLLYDSLTKELLGQFKNFNKSEKYTKEIENGKYTKLEKQSYYDYLILQTVSQLITYINE